MSDTPKDFIRQQIDADVAAGLHGGRVHTRGTGGARGREIL